MKNYIELLESNKNLILTGAPGTGKTYLAKEIAKHIIGLKSDRELKESGQFEFVQFHPSYDYTDFVEGLRPLRNDKKSKLRFELRDGIFKEFCKKALKKRTNEIEFVVNDTSNNSESFADSNETYAENIENFSMHEFEKYLQKVNIIDTTARIYLHSIEKLLGKKEINSRKPVVKKAIYSSLDEICESYEKIKEFDRSNDFHGNYSSAVQQLINFRNSISKQSGQKSQNYLDRIFKKNKKNVLPEMKIKNETAFVFVIDEINRAEISKVFGELFFSIDPGYRGEKGKVKTQYANLQDADDVFVDGFFVPENVYIIGTMNDIDRSVESMDFAMRRRFSWKEVKAEDRISMWDGQIDFWKNDSLKRMNSLNKAIENIQGLSSAYHIGPAYFLKLENYQNESNPFDSLWHHHLEGVVFEYLRGLPDSDELINKLKNAYNNLIDVEND
jgi:5-methylcytosine-specific restriction enzyme B